ACTPTAMHLDSNGTGLPVLWHLHVSHYNEKARWALDYKQVPHLRRPAFPGRQSKISKQLTQGAMSTLPVLRLDGTVIGDSTNIIAALEQRFPDPPLYPADEAARRRALELEDWFDENFGPYIRLLFMHIALAEPRLFLGAFGPTLPAPQRLGARAAFRKIRAGVEAEFGIDTAGVEHAYEKVRATGERFRSELQPSGYLVGDRFSVADLSLAAFLAVVVAPPEFPYRQPQRDHPRFSELRKLLDSYGMQDWARDIYARHRGRSAEVVDRDSDRLQSSARA
ncbi:MAG TPA: glutathione S-transferase family protein, partial [Thermoleophilaceae bacterium]